ncbi:hypothetical protein G3A_10190 [Bacillus sp. 17376]|uniref:UPF0738 protein JCM21738_1917 n=1 Tax=Mesobacillus boroniphilus JCM 21738 TaxID=1294265 RepID=W4RMP0_9BACI|nr:hypothetical protein [Mesobacillus boroniphilus]ESU32644.1 hypothetical protein G3A_10190 [Bacillus sp. 17376]GAE45143.1 hypothetical protein JCM21738_1917 [Mesobacillus boroniphilus JCM 21738]
MNQKILITNVKIENNEVLLSTDIETGLGEFAATGQMLVDSDQLSFIYIIDKEDGYHYVNIPAVAWSVIQEGLQAGAETYLTNNGGRLKLEGFHNEMEYLIENIIGNSNYGEEMVTKVEQVFAAPSA